MNDVVPNRKTPALVEDQSGLEDFVDGVMSMLPGEALAIVGAKLDGLSADEQGEPLGLLLRGLYAHFESLRAILEEGRFDIGMEAAGRAAQLFSNVEINELAAVATGISTYCAAVVELQRFNISAANQLMAQMESALKKAGAFGQRYQNLIDHTKPEQIYISAVPSLMTMDMSNARVIIEQASSSAEKVAHKYYTPGDQGHSLFMGMASLFRANYAFVECNKNIAEFALDAIGEEVSLDAQRARDFLAKADLANAQVKAQLEMAKCLIEMMEIISGLAGILLKSFKAATKPQVSVLRKLKAAAERAVHYAERMGPNGVVFVRAGQSLYERINNLERLVRPSTADFGVYSGLISILLFVLLFSAGVWARQQFGLDLETRVILWTSTGMSLVGGFGLGAVKFRSLFL